MASEKADPNPFSFKTFMKRGEVPAAPPPGSASAGQSTGKKGKKKSAGKTSQGESLPFPDVEEIGECLSIGVCCEIACLESSISCWSVGKV